MYISGGIHGEVGRGDAKGAKGLEGIPLRNLGAIAVKVP